MFLFDHGIASIHAHRILVQAQLRCVGQYLIGYYAGKFVKVQQMVGVDQAMQGGRDETPCSHCEDG